MKANLTRSRMTRHCQAFTVRVCSITVKRMINGSNVVFSMHGRTINIADCQDRNHTHFFPTTNITFLMENESSRVMGPSYYEKVGQMILHIQLSTLVTNLNKKR